MDWFHAVVLAIVQGITEFLPISSSGHLILLPKIMSWTDQGLEIDIAMHIGTLMAVVSYFYKETIRTLIGTLDLARMRASDARYTAIALIVGTIPVVISGLLLKSLVEHEFRNATLIATTSILFGLLLFYADQQKHKEAVGAQVSVSHAVLIGLAQSLALVPGVSRSGITMTAALLLGYARVDAAKFSLLLSIPTTFAAGSLIAVEMAQNGNPELIGDAFLTGALAFVFGYLSIWGMMKWLASYSFTPFVIYRVLLGCAIFVIFV